jgi:hypothetical protein
MSEDSQPSLPSASSLTPASSFGAFVPQRSASLRPSRQSSEANTAAAASTEPNKLLRQRTGDRYSKLAEAVNNPSASSVNLNISGSNINSSSVSNYNSRESYDRDSNRDQDRTHRERDRENRDTRDNRDNRENRDRADRMRGSDRDGRPSRSDNRDRRDNRPSTNKETSDRNRSNNSNSDRSRPAPSHNNLPLISSPNDPSTIDSSNQNHLLNSEWTIYFDRRTKAKPAASSGEYNVEEYETNLQTVGTFNSIEGFWRVYHHILRPSQIELNANYHLFRSDIKPIWEDAANEKGGKCKARQQIYFQGGISLSRANS